MATTDNNVFIENIYKNELPVYYEPPKPKKVVPTEKDLYEADTFSFGTLIGQITNKGSAGYAILDLFDEDSQEYQITKNRLKMSCKLQSAQIDKSKIGQKVKGIPKMWVSRNEEDEINLSLVSCSIFLFSGSASGWLYIPTDTLPFHLPYMIPDIRRNTPSPPCSAR